MHVALRDRHDQAQIRFDELLLRDLRRALGGADLAHDLLERGGRHADVVFRVADVLADGARVLVREAAELAAHRAHALGRAAELGDQPVDLAATELEPGNGADDAGFVALDLLDGLRRQLPLLEPMLR